MRRALTVLTVALFALAMMVGPAAAHVLVVDPPGDGGGSEGWVGGGALPEAAQGEGLITGGPPWDQFIQSPAHDGGLVTACDSLREHGNGVVDIFGPVPPNVTQTTCHHGGH